MVTGSGFTTGKVDAPNPGTDGTALTFQQLWRDAVAAHGERVFLAFMDEAGDTRSWSYTEFDEAVGRVAGMLADKGVTAGDAVHVALRNCPAFLALWLAAAHLGAWIVPVDPASTTRDLVNQIGRTRPKVGVYGLARGDAYEQAMAGTDVPHFGLAETPADLLDGSPLLGPAVDPAPVRPADRLAVMFTSGTTSMPKGVVLSQRNYRYVADVMSSLIGLESRHRYFVTLPLFHANAQYYCFGPAIAVGASVGLTAAFSASRWLSQAAALDVTHASLFAAPIRMILARHVPTPKPLALEHVWFAQSLGERHYEEFAQLVGCLPRQLYGMTETLAVVTADLTTGSCADSIGIPVPGRDVFLCAADTGEVVADGDPGVIHVAGRPGGELFVEYLDDPATTARTLVLSDGRTLLRTGDLARVRDDGRMTFVGRIDDVIKVSGENVSLTEVEAALAQAPGVLEVAVLAEPDEVRDHVPVAFVVPRDPVAPPTTAELEAFAARVLPPPARPRRWTHVAELPRTSVGKIKRFVLKEQLGSVGSTAEQVKGEA